MTLHSELSPTLFVPLPPKPTTKLGITEVLFILQQVKVVLYDNVSTTVLKAMLDLFFASARGIAV